MSAGILGFVLGSMFGGTLGALAMVVLICDKTGKED